MCAGRLRGEPCRAVGELADCSVEFAVCSLGVQRRRDFLFRGPLPCSRPLKDSTRPVGIPREA
eukprot:1801378-Prymnesium_polylepis.1